MTQTPLGAVDAGARRHPPSAIIALVMGIAGLVVLPLVGPILALVFGYQSRREALARPEVFTDELGRVGRVLGWIGLVLVGALVVVGALLVLFLMPVIR